MLQLSYTRNGNKYEIDTTGADADAVTMLAESIGVPAGTVEYLLQYGFKQSLQDAAAQPASAANAEGGDVAAAIDGAMQKRLAAIKSGNVAVRGGGARVDAVESMVRKLAVAAIVKSAKAKGVKPPKGEKLTELRDQLIAKNRATFESKAKELVKVQSELQVEVEL